MLYGKDLATNLRVCPKCNYHLKLDLNTRLAALLDEGFEEITVPAVSDDPLGFRDTKKYKDRLSSARRKQKQPDAYRVVRGAIRQQQLVVVAMTFNFMGGSMGRAVGEAVVTAANVAVRENKPLLAMTASGGARMQEGTLALMQMARTTAAIQAVKEAALPYIVLMTDPTTGGVTASFAMLGDVLLSEPGALIGFAGPRVIEQTMKETLPEGFQTAEYLLEHGMLDAVVPRKEQRKVIGTLLAVLKKPGE
jgi:acetyl-CoA carboxylase carboxyl transferase subunit beta